MRCCCRLCGSEYLAPDLGCMGPAPLLCPACRPSDTPLLDVVPPKSSRLSGTDPGVISSTPGPSANPKPPAKRRRRKGSAQDKG